MVNAPTNLDECFERLMAELTPAMVQELRRTTENDLCLYHHSLGRALRNEWGLWVGSPLTEWFGKLGILHPDDMSGIILTSFRRHLNDETIRLDEQIKFYLDFWHQQGLKADGTAPEPHPGETLP